MSFVDGHCDTISKIFETRENLLKNSGHVDAERLYKCNAPVQFFALFIYPGYYQEALAVTLEALNYYFEELDKCNKMLLPAYSYDDILNNKKTGKASAVLSFEGAYQIGERLDLFKVFYKMGVRLCGLTWNYSNALASGINDIKKTGLTKAGIAAVELMNDLGIITDVSHLSEQSFWDVCKASKKPFIASHSNAFSVTPHDRNLKDAQIKAIAEAGGTIGLNFHYAFLSKSERPVLDDVFLHMEHIINVGGEDVIALGSDFDGLSNPPEELSDICGFLTFIEAAESRFGGRIAEKMAEKNMLRVIKEVWK